MTLRPRLAILGLLCAAWSVPAAGQGYPYFPPPGMGYSATNGNLTLQNLTLESVTGIVLCDGSGGLCAAATSTNVVALWTGAVSTSNYLRSDGQLTAPPITAPAGTSGEVQYNNAGVFGGNTGFTYDGSGNATLTGTLTANLFSGSGASLNSLNGSNISSGTVPLARLPTIPATDISGLAPSATTDTTNASNITSGTLSNSRLSGVALLASANSFTSSGNVFSNVVAVTSGAGASLYDLDNAGVHVADICLNTEASGAACLLSGDVPNDVSVRTGSAGTLHLSDVNGNDFDDASQSTFTFRQTTIAAPSATTAPWTNASNLTSGTLSNSLLSGVCLSSGTNCPAAALGTITVNITSAGASTPTITSCNRCVSPSITRASAGVWSLATGVTLSTSMAAVCGLSAAGTVSGVVLLVFAAADTTSQHVSIDFNNGSGTATDPASGVEVSCIVGL